MTNLFGRPLTHYLLTVGLLASAAAFLATAWNYPQDARAFPVVSAVALLALSALDLLALTNTVAGRAIRDLLNPTINVNTVSKPIFGQVATVLSLAALVTALVLLGIELTVPLYLLASLRFRAGRSWASSLVITAGVSVAMWLLFALALQLDLYKGYLFARFLAPR